MTVKGSLRTLRGQATIEEDLAVMTSSSGSFLAFDTSQLPATLPCQGIIRLPLLTTVTEKLPHVMVQVMSRGRLVAQSIVTRPDRPLVELHMTPLMSPRVRVLVYSQLESGEVLADAIGLDVETCFPNEVTVTVNDTAAEPHGEVTLGLSAAPNSRCTVAVRDAGLGHKKRGRHPFGLTQERANDILQKLDNKLDKPAEEFKAYCEGLEQQLFRNLLRAGVKRSSLDILMKGFRKEAFPGVFDKDALEVKFVSHPYADAADVFRFSGTVPLANRGIHHAPCVKQELYPWDSPSRFRRSVAFLPLKRGAQSLYGGDRGGDQDVFFDDRSEVLYNDVQTLDENGTGQVTLHLPGQVAGWVASAFCTHPENGLGISKQVTFKASKLMFAKMFIPHSIKTGETLRVPVTVFNNYDSYLSVRVELVSSEFLDRSSGARRSSWNLCLAPHSRDVAPFPLTFSRAGAFNISVNTEAHSGYCQQPNTVHPPREILTKQIVVRPVGFQQEDTKTHFICLDSGKSQTVDVEFARPNGLVPGSAWLYVSVFGDQLEPSSLDLSREVVKLTRGGAEPNLKSVVKNIYIHRYYTATNLMTTNIRTRLEDNIDRGFSTALRYKRRDGSFSAHGDQDAEGSLWLTVLTLKAFRDAAQFHSNVAAGMSNLTDSVDWVMRQQHSDGCFYPVGELLHKELRGGIDERKTGAMTTYVMLSLHGLIENYRLADGLTCMHQYVSKPSVSSYTKALVAYTYIELGLESRASVLIQDLLKDVVTEGTDSVHWREERTVPIYGALPVADLEMTSYITLSLIKLSGVTNLITAKKAVTWISNQRDELFFKSPQAAAASLEALSAFALRTHASTSRSTVSVSIGNSHPFFVHVDSHNRLLHQTHTVKHVEFPARAHFEVTGGCVTLETSLRYVSSLEIPHPAFSLSAVATERPSSSPGSTFAVNICTSVRLGFRRADRAVLVVDLPSGFVAASASLREERYFGHIKEFGLNEDFISVTLEAVSQDTKCFSFRIVRASVVENLKPSKVHIIDFYDPADQAQTEYTIGQTASLTSRYRPLY